MALSIPSRVDDRERKALKSAAGEADGPPVVLRDIRYAAIRLGLPVNGVYRLVEAKAIACVNVGSPTAKRRTLRFTDAQLDAYIDANTHAAKPRPAPRPVAPPPGGPERSPIEDWPEARRFQ